MRRASGNEQAVTLGLPADISVWDLMDEWERRMDAVTPLPVSMVPDDPHGNGAFPLG